MSVGENIRRIREARGLNQAQLADRVGIAQPWVCQIERGTKNPSLQLGKLIAEVLGCTLDDLLAENPAGTGQTGKGDHNA